MPHLPDCECVACVAEIQAALGRAIRHIEEHGHLSVLVDAPEEPVRAILR